MGVRTALFLWLCSHEERLISSFWDTGCTIMTNQGTPRPCPQLPLHLRSQAYLLVILLWGLKQAVKVDYSIMETKCKIRTYSLNRWRNMEEI